ncbi:transposase family protein [Streptomyces netropsis]
MGDALLQDLWFGQTNDVVIENIDTDDESVVIRARAHGLQAACPSCGVLSDRVHSRYVRRLADSPVGGRPVVIASHVRRFRCREGTCPRATFAEQISGLTIRHGRRSIGLQKVLRTVGLMLAGRAGTRLVDTLASVVSRSTLLRLVRALPDPEPTTPRGLGVDEFALRKGHVYGTILVDIETRRPWLRWLSGLPITRGRGDLPRPVDCLCRGRPARGTGGHARGRSLANLEEPGRAVEKTVIQHRALLREPQQTAPVSPSSAPLELAPPSTVGPQRTGRLARRTRRTREQHAAVHRLLAEGVGLRQIARELDLARNTVRRLAHARTPDELLVGQWTGRPSFLDPHKPHLNQRWTEGSTNAAELFAELRERGYQGDTTIVRQYVRRLREAFPRDDAPRKPPSVRDVTSWITRHPDILSTDQAQQLKDILTRCPALDSAAEHMRAFADLMNNRQGRHLHQWIAPVEADDLPALHTFAVEGHNNKIKMLKRQMFGRASFDLLRKRVLLAARGRKRGLV